VAGRGLPTLAGAMASGARLVLYGYLGGLDTPLPFIPMLRKGLTLRAYSVFRTTSDAQTMSEARDYIIGGVQRGAFRPLVDRVFALDDVVAAHRYLEASEQVGKVVISTRA
jgi:NADPH:quinone reductase-like Zn-dependent oxidoreductase